MFLFVRNRFAGSRSGRACVSDYSKDSMRFYVNYSERSASIGSTCAARRAGSNDASSAAVVSTTATEA